MDRNPIVPAELTTLVKSLSARRAWIEMSRAANCQHRSQWSLSARRAWIEIKYVVKDSDFSGSLSARRAWIEIVRFSASLILPLCRSPQGERG